MDDVPKRAECTTDEVIKVEPPDSSRVLWRATALEEQFALSHEHMSDMVCYAMTVACDKPMQEQHMKTVLQLLYRKCPNLRVCQKRDKSGQLWTCEMKEERILLNFSDKETDDFAEEILKQAKLPHEVTTGPMWRVKVTKVKETRCVKTCPELETKDDRLVYKYHIFLTLHHAITDGHTNIRIYGFLLNLLNEIFSGKTSLELDDGVQLAEFVNQDRNEQILKEVQEYLNDNKPVQQKYSKKLQHFQAYQSILSKIFPGDPIQDSRTDNVRGKVSRDTTSAFFKKAKNFGVTIHSAFCSAVEAAIIDILVRNGRIEREFEIFSAHDVNNRRFWEENGEFLLGPHISCHYFTHILPRDMKKDFWLYSQRFHKTFHEGLNNKEGLIYALLEQGQSKPVTTDEEFQAVYKRLPFIYVTSNIGDITRSFKPSDEPEYKHVRVEDFHQVTNNAPGIVTGCFCVQTLNGELLIGFDFDTSNYARTLAEELMEGVLQIIAEVSK